MPFTKITSNIFAIGGSNLSNPGDAMIYLVKTKSNKLVLIDSGIDSLNYIENNISDTGNNPIDLIALILTHCHIDHTGSAHSIKQKYPKVKIIAHEWERSALEGDKGTEKMIAADWYGVKYNPVHLDIVVKKEEEDINLGDTIFKIIQTPGHTPGSIAVIVKDDNKKILFGQDIHGPFMQDFNSNINDWHKSMKILMSKNADILAEGHYGIYKGKDNVRKFIASQLRQNGF
ncbi:MAG: MBL fold metallo-hydrolase [Candidatus Lokiarchaeota archaeon]|nr:MBL fold metallo-hydrolase [Candidatus Lokiarchaeota archaeon]